jgi:protein TonB
MPLAVNSSLSESVLQQDPWTPQNELEQYVVVVGYGKSGSENVAPQQDIQVTRDSERKIAPGAIAYNDVEQKPVFQEGQDGYMKFLSNNIRYPVIAQENGIVGKIVVSYVIDKEGNVTNVQSPVKIERLSMELERIIKLMPAWKPGSQNGQNVAVQCYAFAEYRLQN